jgi:hypothetical protein
VRGWNAFINQFVDPDELERLSTKGEQQLRAFLCKRFNLEFLPYADVEAGVNSGELEALTRELSKRDAFKHGDIARNDALMVLGVYALPVGSRSGEYDGWPSHLVVDQRGPGVGVHRLYRP